MTFQIQPDLRASSQVLVPLAVFRSPLAHMCYLRSELFLLHLESNQTILNLVILELLIMIIFSHKTIIFMRAGPFRN